MLMLARTSLLRARRAEAASGASYSAFGFRDSSSTTSGSFSETMDIGAANANRYVIVAVEYGDASGLGTFSSVTVGGVSCMEVVSTSDLSNYGVHIFITNEPVTSGTTATVAVTTFINSLDDIQVQVWSVIMTSATAYHTDSNSGTGTSRALSGPLQIPAGGFAIVALTGNASVDAATINQGFTERVDAEISSHYGFAADLESVAGLSSTITITSSGSGTGAWCGASWKGDGSTAP